ncbi:uncharacterized protein EV420DRAFT_1639020 [Desarmillaria tabescens]|uniref:MYND-type domain-containing protein n=1 Tax=Armillaria tabescens TaxID=1929756 RepID=A0AA39NC65_ARMTA|nr:uncharacterized protein EV420DRAFT_1639020 [Desarmillaria tabescens]KAK0462932.1 hypothetical protein EV420DRAFT_1639020 [Desarmillaria tabescens]
MLPSTSTLYDPAKGTLYNTCFRTINICLDSPVWPRIIHNPSNVHALQCLSRPLGRWMTSLFTVIYSEQADDLDSSNVWPIVHGISEIISKMRTFTTFIEGMVTIPLARNVIHLWIKANECYVPGDTHYLIRDMYDVVVGASEPMTRLFTKTVSAVPRRVLERCLSHVVERIQSPDFSIYEFEGVYTFLSLPTFCSPVINGIFFANRSIYWMCYAFYRISLHVRPENESEVFKNYFPRLMNQVAASFSFVPHLLPQAIEGRILDSILKGQLYTDQLFDKDVAVGHITETLDLLNTNLIFRSVSRLTYKHLRKIEHFGRETALLPGPILEAWMAMREKAIQVNKFDKFYATLEILSCSNYHCQSANRHTLPRTEVRRCGGCETVFYCSVECQKQDWKYHREICRLCFRAVNKDGLPLPMSLRNQLFVIFYVQSDIDKDTLASLRQKYLDDHPGAEAHKLVAALDYTKIVPELDIRYADEYRHEDHLDHYVKVCKDGGGRLCFVRTPFVDQKKGVLGLFTLPTLM